MSHLKIPTQQELSSEIHAIFENVRSSFDKKEKIVINLLVSQLNESNYCVTQHTHEAEDFGLNPDEIAHIRKGSFPNDPKLDALARLTKELVETRGKPGKESLAGFYKADYNYGHVIDLTVAIGEKTIANYVCNIAPPLIASPKQNH